LIPNSMYGPNDNFDLENSHVLSALIRKFHEAKIENKESVTLWGSGKPRREFIFCEDVADASIFAMKNAEKFQNSHYNIGTGVDYSIEELAEIISRIVGYNGELKWDRTKPDGAPRKLLDSSKFFNLGWKPLTDIETGLNITYEWYLKNTQMLQE
ncbi:MAG: NAD-dependent epimerase/dehydratase family protein, partial [Spirochaetes bacterium]|nr:NAD-dependent epimerase/dehydratase family protein [Spirochaetota bacterium]